MKKLNYKQVLEKISKNILNAKNRIYATHLIEVRDDLVLPAQYIYALNSTKCLNKKRVVFGDKILYDEFNYKEIFFKNHFSNKKYIRMIIIDNEVYFKKGQHFFHSSQKIFVKLFELYFNYISYVKK